MISVFFFIKIFFLLKKFKSLFRGVLKNNKNLYLNSLVGFELMLETALKVKKPFKKNFYIQNLVNFLFQH